MTPVLLTLARGLHLAAVLSMLGALVFRALVADRALLALEPPALHRFQRRLVLGSAALAIGLGLAWLPLQAIEMAGGSAELSTVLPIVLLQTGFGTALLLRLGLLAAAAALLGSGERRWRVGAAAGLAALAAALQARMGHAAAAGDWLLPAAEVLHVLAAGAWLGGLLPLWAVLRWMPTDARAARRFSPLGGIAVATLAGTALVQGWTLIGGFPGLVGTAYGRVALAKLALFAALLALAALNRQVFTPALATDPIGAARHLRRSIAVETVLGLATVAAAGWLAMLAPGAHERPDWPFPVQPSLVAMAEPELRAEVLLALAALGGALGLALLAVAWRRGRWPVLGAALLVAGFALPHLDLLLVPAYPTSFYRSPTGFAAASIARGATLFQANCAGCHGAQGRGDGPLAKGLKLPPADLTADHLWEHGDGEMFWWLTHGIDAPDGGLAMPGFAAVLSEDERWDVIDFVHANAAGAEVAADRNWPFPVAAPALELGCGAIGTLAALRGQPVRIVAAAEPGTAAPPGLDGVATILLQPEAAAGHGGCLAAGPEAWAAYAIVAGVPPAALDGTQILVDPAGWLRDRWRPGDPPGWTTPEGMLALRRAMAAQPIAPPAESGHHHH